MKWTRSTLPDTYFKTSYVIVYHKYHFLVYMHLLYFKTSYVIVYHNAVLFPDGSVVISKHLMLLFISISIKLQALSNVISKHLMLLFIGNIESGTTANYEFQNILCYCLSRFPNSRPSVYYISKHLMLLFIIIVCLVILWV